MKKFVLLIFASTVGVSCYTMITTEGSKVKLISEYQGSTCEFVGVVTAYSQVGPTTGHNAENARVQVRNKAADLGGNALHIIGTSTNGRASTVTGKAFSCEF